MATLERWMKEQSSTAVVMAATFPLVVIIETKPPRIQKSLMQRTFFKAGAIGAVVPLYERLRLGHIIHQGPWATVFSN